MENPKAKPPVSRIRGIRLCSGIFTESEFAIVNVAERSAEDDGDKGETHEADEGQNDVVASEERPGFHVSSLIDYIQYSWFIPQSKGRLTG